MRTWVAGVLAMLPFLVSAPPSHYSYSPASGKYSAAFGLNNEGRYAINNNAPELGYGTAAVSGMPEGVPSLSGKGTQIRDINNKGEAVGISATANGVEHSFLYSLCADPEIDFPLRGPWARNYGTSYGGDVEIEFRIGDQRYHIWFNTNSMPDANIRTCAARRCRRRARQS